MGQSKIREQQIRDLDVLTEAEHTSTNHYFENLADTTTLSGHNGRYLKVSDLSNVIEYGTGYSGTINIMTGPTTSGAMVFNYGILASYTDL